MGWRPGACDEDLETMLNYTLPQRKASKKGSGER